MEQTSFHTLGLLYERCLYSELHGASLARRFCPGNLERTAKGPGPLCGFVCSLRAIVHLQLEKNDNNYLFLRRFFFGGARFGADSAPSRRRALFVARVGAAAMGSSGHGCFGYRPRCSARTEG